VAPMRMRSLCALLVAGFGLTSALQVRADLVDAIVVIVHDSLVTLVDVQGRNEQTADQLRRDYGAQPAVLQRKLAEMQSENLEKLVERQLILHDLKNGGRVPADLLKKELDKAANREIDGEIRALYGGDRMRLVRTLQQRGMTYERYQQQMSDRIAVAWARQQNISSGLIASPHKVEAYYLAHREEYRVEDEVKLRMIVLNKSDQPDAPDAKRLAQDILVKLKEGVGFAEMATNYSQGSQRAQGGDLGWVKKSSLRPELATPAFSLKKGEVSGVLDLSDAVYLLFAEDARSKQYQALNDVRERIEKALLDDEGNRLEKQWIDRLKKKTFVRYY
jgi:peptidyl-prolyl cis-trans isomerase SurA